MAKMINGNEIFEALMDKPAHTVAEVEAAVNKAVSDAAPMRDMIAGQRFQVENPGAGKSLESSVAYAEPAAERGAAAIQAMPAPEAEIQEEAEASGPDFGL